MNDDEILKSLRDAGLRPVVWKDLIVTFPDKSHFVKCPECGRYTEKMRVPTNRDWLDSLSTAELAEWIKNTAVGMSDAELLKWMEEKHETD